MALSSEHGFPLWLAVATALRGWTIALQGQYDEGIALIYEGSAAVRTMGIRARGLTNFRLLADACIQAGRFSEALDTLTQVRTLVGRPEHFAYVELLQGTLLSKWGACKASEAENCFRAAIEIARKSNQKMTELQASTGLARLLASRGVRDEARAMLAGIYNWFTEGFDTADLKEAKALLDELNA
jgi:predicted ATPase